MTHACISEEFITTYGISTIMMSDTAMCVSTPLGSGAILDRVCKNVDVVIDGCHMPVDMIVLSISDFDVILGMNWLNKYGVNIDCAKAVLSSNMNDREVSYTLLRQRPRSMLSMELWEKPRISAMMVEEEECSIEMVPIVYEFDDVFPDNFPSLLPDQKIKFGIDLVPGSAPISNQPYHMAPTMKHSGSFLSQVAHYVLHLGSVQPVQSPKRRYRKVSHG